MVEVSSYHSFCLTYLSLVSVSLVLRSCLVMSPLASAVSSPFLLLFRGVFTLSGPVLYGNALDLTPKLYLLVT